MLQIIGWLLCVYLVVKGFELIAMKSVWAYVGAAIAFVAAPIFLLLINAQSNSPGPLARGSSTAELPSATDADLNAVTQESVDAAERALANADAAIANADAALANSSR